MASEHSERRYRTWYAKLLRLYSKPYYERFGEGMEQTFNDLLRERRDSERGVFAFALWMFVETTAGILRENLRSFIMRNVKKRLGVWAVVVAVILSIPLLAMQFNTGVNWGLMDFVTAGCLLFGCALVYELATKKMINPKHRVAVGIAVTVVLLYLWVELAVGVFTNWGS